MIRTLQKKFVITAMIAVSVLLLAVLGALNIFNAVSNARQTEALLDELGRQSMGPVFSRDFENTPPKDGVSDSEQRLPEVIRHRRGFLDEPVDDNARMAALYFTVDLDEHGQALRANTSHIASVSEEEAIELAGKLDVARDTGSLDNYRYKMYVTPEGGYRIVFLDSSSRHTSVLRVLLLSALLGLVSWLLMLALVMLLSRKAILPIAENMERQRQFVTDAGHELKTPVAIITANVDAMELRTGENKYSRNIRSQADRLSELVKNLLTLARVDEYSVLEKPEQIDFTALCTELFSTFRESAELKQIHYSLDLEGGLTISGDRNLLTQFCSILADNAVKYCPEKGEILVRLWQDAKGVSLRISNSVTEVPNLDRLFDRFYRADSSRNQKNGGFGIGLSAARTIAKLHQADLTSNYDETAGMICFTVHFPV